MEKSGGNLLSLKFNALSKADEGVYFLVVGDSSSKSFSEASKSQEVQLKVSCESEKCYRNYVHQQG